jgi:hypothetical protein
MTNIMEKVKLRHGPKGATCKLAYILEFGGMFNLTTKKMNAKHLSQNSASTMGIGVMSISRRGQWQADPYAKHKSAQIFLKSGGYDFPPPPAWTCWMPFFFFSLILKIFFFFLLRLGVRAASNSAYSGYPELWILRYPAHRYRCRDSNPRPFG